MKLAAGLLAAGALVCSGAWAQTKAARMFVGFPPGGNVDILARVFAEQLAQGMGHPFVVETRPGATGQIAAEVVKAASPDGYTVMLSPDSTVLVRPLTMRKPPYDPITDFTPIAHTGLSPNAIAVALSVPAKNLRELGAWMKANPEKAQVALPGLGASNHFFTLAVAQELGVKVQIVPYKGSGPAVTDLSAGHVPVSINPLGTMATQHRAGKIRVVGVTGKERSPNVPEVPTLIEQGYPSLNQGAWFGIFGPGAMPPELVSRLNAVVLQAERTPVIRERMRSLDLEIVELSPQDLAAQVKREYERWQPLVKASGFIAED